MKARKPSISRLLLLLSVEAGEELAAIDTGPAHLADRRAMRERRNTYALAAELALQVEQTTQDTTP